MRRRGRHDREVMTEMRWSRERSVCFHQSLRIMLTLYKWPTGPEESDGGGSDALANRSLHNASGRDYQPKEFLLQVPSTCPASVVPCPAAPQSHPNTRTATARNAQVIFNGGASEGRGQVFGQILVDLSRGCQRMPYAITDKV